jgi:hypothetical protein
MSGTAAGDQEMDINAEPAERILDVALRFYESKVLLTAVELDVFTAVGEQALETDQLRDRLGLHARGARDFFDALAALGFLEQDTQGRYRNAPHAAEYLDRSKSSYIGGYLQMCNTRLYPAWGSLTDALRTGRPHPRPHRDDDSAPYRPPYADMKDGAVFLQGMTGSALLVARAIAARFDWSAHRTLVDVGTSEGCLAVEVGLRHSHITGFGFDLPAAKPFFERRVRTHELHDRFAFISGDFLKDPFPAADVVVMGRVLHNWDRETRQLLLGRAFDALPQGGELLVYERLIDDERASASGLLASLNMLVSTPAGSEFTGTECIAWMHQAGFARARVEPLVAWHSMVIATK